MRILTKIYFVLLLLFLCSFRIEANNGGLQFIENKGQWPEEVLYAADIGGGKVVLQKDRMVFLLYNDSEIGHGLLHHKDVSEIKDLNERLNPDIIQAHRYDVVFGGDAKEIKGINEKITRYNYFSGSDPSKWASNVKSFQRIVYTNAYEGIDIVFYSMGSYLKYDFIVHPGADLNDINLKYEGLENIELNEGKLSLQTSFDELFEEIPFAFQEYDDIKKAVSFKYKLTENEVSFISTDEIDETRVLVIDPILIFSTYSGSEADNWGNTATFDNMGNLFSGGITNHSRGGLGVLGEFNATPGAFQTEYAGIWDVGIAKYDSTGSQLLFATYLGGSDSESPQSLIVNNSGDLVILGVTGSANFPVTPNAHQTEFKGGEGGQIINGVPVPAGSDLFISILSPDGSTLKASTFLGGSENEGIINPFSPLNKNYGDESRGDVIMDFGDNIYISSRTSSQDIGEGKFINSNSGLTDGIVAKFNSDLSALLWGAYIGGSDEDVALSIKLYSDKVYLAGGTNSIDFPTTPGTLYPLPTGNIDGWVAAISQDGDSLYYSTYVGTTDYDQVYQIDVDFDGNVYLLGQTRGPYPITEGVYNVPNSGQFMQKLNASLDSSIWSTQFGAGDGEPDISITAFLVNDCNNIYVSGWGSNTLISGFIAAGFPYTSLSTIGLPVTPDAVQSFTAGSDFYLAVFTDDASELLYATFFGSSSSQVHVDGGTSRFDKQGIVYHSVCASCAVDDSSFPTTPGSWAEENGSRGCNNAVFKFDLANIDARFTTNNEDFSAPNIKAGCPPFKVAFENKSVGGQIYEWEFGDGADTVTNVRDTIFHTYNTPGRYQVQLRIFDQTTCKEEDFQFAIIEVFNSSFSLSNSVSICGGESINLSASGATQYDWSPSDGLSSTNSSFVVASPDSTTTYKVMMRDDNGCERLDSVTVSVVPEIIPVIQINQLDKCEGIPSLEVINLSENFDEVEVIVTGANVNVTDSISEISFDQSGEYTIRVNVNNKQCSKTIEETVSIEELYVPNVFTPNGDGVNDLFEITSTLPVNLTVVNRYGKSVYQAENYQNTWNGGDLASGVYYYSLEFGDGEECKGWVQILK